MLSHTVVELNTYCYSKREKGKTRKEEGYKTQPSEYSMLQLLIQRLEM